MNTFLNYIKLEIPKKTTKAPISELLAVLNAFKIIQKNDEPEELPISVLSICVCM